MVSLPISVLAVTLLVNVVKLFDLIYVLTNGGPGTSSRVIALHDVPASRSRAASSAAAPRSR